MPVIANNLYLLLLQAAVVTSLPTAIQKYSCGRYFPAQSLQRRRRRRSSHNLKLPRQHATSKDSNEITTTTSVDDPRKAFNAVSSIIDKLGEYSSNMNSWDDQQMEMWQKEYSDLVQNVAVPTLAFATSNLVISTAIFFSILVSLDKTGRGFSDVQTILGAIPLLGQKLQGALTNIDPKIGNGALSLVLVDLVAPLSIPLAVTLSPFFSKWYTERFDVIRETLQNK
mmetsp:Transcript_3007/g.4599  ORF Transcript_3007/g.4599 Transcript_3007/m.4599 type:complete len:226 (+) Transcript_3007:254-931(+)